MRLTLRTLLAYMDDVLMPAETKIMGQKVQESDVAGKLISLIRLVVRQRRLKAPSVSGPNMGIDPNVVAQYLDNTLAPEQVMEVEKVLLSSDELLAEVAACHQVLTLVMGKQAELPQANRDRLYALGPVDQSDQLRVEEPRANGAADGAVKTALARDAERAAEAKTDPRSAQHEVPEYLRQSSWSQKMVPAGIIALLVVVCVGLLISDPGFLIGIREAKRELTGSNRGAPAGQDSVQGEGAGKGNPGDNKTPGDAVAGAAVVSPSQTTVPGTPGIPPSPSLDRAPPPDVPEPEMKPNDNPSAVAVKPVEPDGGPADAAVAVNRTAPATPTAPSKTAPPMADDPAPLLNAVPVQYTSSDGVVLRFDDQQMHWFLLPRRSAVQPDEKLVVLEPYEAVVDIDRGALIATILGDSAVRILPPDRVTSTGIDIERGRLILKAGQKEAGKNPVISVRVGLDLWTLELLSSDTVCTIEVAPREPDQFEKPLGDNWYYGTLRVLSGGVNWNPNGGPAIKVAADSSLEIVSPQAAKGVPAPVTSSFLPDWTDIQKRKQAPLRRFSTIFERQFEPDRPVEMTLLALLKDSNAKIVELAVHGLSLTGSVPGLVQALAECTFEEGRSAACEGLRIWLGREADRGPALESILVQRYPAAEADAIYDLLWGFRAEDATNRAQCLKLVGWLRSSHVEIRELAYDWIVRLSGRKWEFRATDVPTRREGHVRKIESQIISAGGLVKPTENSTPKP